MSGSPPTLTATAKIPRATYRLQLNAQFRLADALALVPYLQELGISHVYTSPLLKALPGSAHGYDVCDFNQLNPELGTEADLAALVLALRERSMGLVLDMVPNHMGIGGPENRWWWDVLTCGPASQYAGYFDIDWQSPDPQLRGKVLLPVLGDHYPRTVEKGELQLHFNGNGFTLRYGGHQFPVAPASVAKLPPAGADGASAGAINDAVRELNADPEALDALVQQQHYRLTFWPHGNAEVNYRRFFHITTLAGIRVEDERVFADAHELLRRWLAADLIDGLRVDHPDGLRDPERYLVRLRALAPANWIVVEKILEPGEALPAAWPVAGTTGYDFLNGAGGLFIDPAGESALTGFYAGFTGEPVNYPAIVLEKKQFVLQELFAADVNHLVELLSRIAVRHWHYSDFIRDELRAAVTEVAARFPVYRTYLRPPDDAVSETDAARIREATAAARRHRPDLAPELFDFIGHLLFLRLRGGGESEFVARFQQLTGPAMAKGVEDTTFYCFNRLTALNEVGGDPGTFGVSMAAFHETCRRQQTLWPDTMLATSTHDTKRSEDVRARISLLSEIPEAWSQAVRRWSAGNERHRRGGWPDRNAEYFFYQTLVGAWPLPVERALACMEKAVSEAKQHTSWAKPNADYLDALRGFITATLGDPRFINDLEQFLAPLIEAGYVNSLAQTLLKLTAPGVPDIYQGNELWDLSLMDPDNRRPVDFELRRRLLAESTARSAEQAWQRRADGLPKLWLIRRVLAQRKHRPELFNGSSPYEPLLAQGPKAGCAVAFMRGQGAITLVPRLTLGLKGNWADTTLELPQGNWRNQLDDTDVSGGRRPMAGLLEKFPVALLTRKEPV